MKLFCLTAAFFLGTVSFAAAQDGRPIDGVTYLQAIANARKGFRAELAVVKAEIMKRKQAQVDELRKGYRQQSAQAGDRLERAALCQQYYARKKEFEARAAQEIGVQQAGLQKKLDEKLVQIRKQYGVKGKN